MGWQEGGYLEVSLKFVPALGDGSVVEGWPLEFCCRSSTTKPCLMYHGGIRFQGAEGGSLRMLDSDAKATSASSTRASSTSRRRNLSSKDRGVSSGRGTSNSGLSFVRRNKRHAAKAFRKLTDEQVHYIVVITPLHSSDEISSWLFSSKMTYFKNWTPLCGVALIVLRLPDAAEVLFQSIVHHREVLL